MRKGCGCLIAIVAVIAIVYYVIAHITADMEGYDLHLKSRATSLLLFETEMNLHQGKITRVWDKYRVIEITTKNPEGKEVPAYLRLSEHEFAKFKSKYGDRK